ncbi:MAG: hypothetical protein HZC36_09555 [Armatimonadetes bacterium]|nr:hypothetical protein [Armatimonadota bacterium]
MKSRRDAWALSGLLLILAGVCLSMTFDPRVCNPKFGIWNSMGLYSLSLSCAAGAFWCLRKAIKCD